MSALNFTNGSWPYRVSQDSTSLTITIRGQNFRQAITPGAAYDFRPDEIKETLVLPSAGAAPRDVLGFGFQSSYLPIVNGTLVNLVDQSGDAVWQSAPFTAQDSSPASRFFPNPVQSIAWSPGALTIHLDPDMLTRAQYPLILDPTWILKASSSNVWTGTLDSVTSDWGDANLRLGSLADNFNDGTNEIWTTTSGHSFSLSGGRAALTATEIHASGTWSNLTLGTTLNFASCGAANVMFRYTSSSSEYYLTVNFAGQTVTLYKVIAGVTAALSPTLAVAMSANTNYDVKVVAQGNSFEIWWAGPRVWSGTDPSPPPSPLSGNVGLSETTSKCTLYADNVRVHDGSHWSGNYTSVVRDAYKGQTGDVVTQLRFLGTADSSSDVDLWVNTSSDNVTWGGWHLVKTMAAPGTYYAVPDVDQKRFYQVRAVLRTGVDATPSVSEIDANEAAPPSGIAASTNTGLSPWYLYIGGDVNAVSGNLVLSWTDLSARAKGYTLSIVRTYNSALAGVAGPFGLGTMDPYHAHLSFPAGGNVTYTAGDGSVWTFVTVGGTAYSPPRGLHDNLIRNADGTYTLWVSDGSRTNFNTAGQLMSLVDRNGNHLTFTYTSGNPTKVADDSGLSLTFTYDASNRVSSVADSGNRRVLYTYDTSNRLTTFTDPMGFTENYTYDASNRLVQRVDRAGHVDRFVYDSNGRVTQIWTGEWSYASNLIRWQVEAYAISYVSGTQTTATNALGGVTTATFNSLGNPTSVVGPSVGCALCRGGNATSYTWDGEYDTLTVADGRGDTTTTLYDWMGGALSVRDPSGNSTVRTYANVQNATQFLTLVLASRNARLVTTRYTYYVNGNLYATILPGGNTSYRFYDASGSLTRLQDFRGNSVTYGYDAHEFRTSAADAGGNTTTYQNDILGRTWNVTTPGGNTTRTVYDADGRVTSTTDPLLHATMFT